MWWFCRKVGGSGVDVVIFIICLLIIVYVIEVIRMSMLGVDFVLDGMMEGI